MNEDSGTEVDDSSASDFADGFANLEAPTATPGQTDKPAENAETPAIEYAQLTKAEYEELKGRAALVEELKATQEKSFGTAFGKIGGIERTIQQLQAGPQIEISQEDIDALREDFPPLAAALEKVRNMRGLPGAGMDAAKLDELVQQRIAPALDSINARVAQAVEMRLLAKQHPDFREVDQSDDFKAWVQQQPKSFVDQLVKASTEYDSDFVGSAMTKFKQSRKAAANQSDPASARRSRMSAAVTPRGSGTPAASDPLDEFNAGFSQG